MSKKKGLKKNANEDFTINDCANAPKPVSRVKKSVPEPVTPEVSWDEIQDENFDIVEEINPDGTKNFVYRKKKTQPKSELDNKEECPSNVYPEIIWYHVSQYIKPEEVGIFARINKATYAITKRESFWRTLYKRYCANHPKLPDRLRIENSYKLYGLRQRVIRALYHTYDVFVKKVARYPIFDGSPHELIKQRCVNVWYYKGPSYWSVFFKFKKTGPQQRVDIGVDFIEELGRIDANPDEDAQVLHVTCRSFNEMPPLMGMTLSSVALVLAQGYGTHLLHLGFNTSCHVSRDILPECCIVLDKVVNILVLDWWNPKYPHFDNSIPSHMTDEESLPVLKKDFFKIQDGDL